MKKQTPAGYFNGYDYQSLITGDFDVEDPLFHYTTLGTLLTILEKKQLRFTNRLYLNDYSEGQYVLDLCMERIEEIWPKNSRYSKERFVEELSAISGRLKHKQFSIYQVSLSGNGDSLSMWNYYSKGDGVNIQFSLSKLVNSFESQFSSGIQWPVGFLHGFIVYTRDKQLKILRKMLQDFSQIESPLDDWYMFVSWAVLYVGTFFKHIGFYDELEYRIAFNPFFDVKKPEECLTIQPLKREEPYCVDVYQRGNMLVPYIDIDFDAEAVEGIVLSPRTERENIANGLQIALRKDGFDTNKIAIEKSKVPVRF